MSGSAENGRGWRRAPDFMGMSCWQRDLPDGHLSVLKATEDGAVHLSISHRRRSKSGIVPGRNPRWDEIKEARYRFCPEVKYMVMVLPPMEEYVNVHETTFHLWESKEGLVVIPS